MHIDDYGFGRIVVDGREERKDLILTRDGVHPRWWRKDGHGLVIEDLEVVLDAEPDVLVVGTGANGMMRPDPGLAAELERHGIRMEVKTTDVAVERANELFREGANAAAAFHLTC